MSKYVLSKEEAIERAKAVSEINYEIFLSLFKGEAFAGKVNVKFDYHEAAPLWLDFKGSSIDYLSVNSQEFPVDYQNSRIYLPNLSQGTNLVTLRFQNTYSNDGLGLHKISDPVDNEIYLYTQFEPFAANRVFPCFDQPDLKATFSLSVLAPEHWEVISNSLTEKISNVDQDSSFYLPFSDDLPSKIHVFKPISRISTYVVAVCAGPYSKFPIDCYLPSNLYCRKSMAKYLNPIIYQEWTQKGFEFYNSFFDFPYPFEKYDQVFVPEFNFLAMENIGCVVFDENFLFKDGVVQNKLLRACIIFLHEMSHMWFGNLVTMKWWDDLWLNESFATFISAYCISQQFPEKFPDIWTYFMVKARTAIKEDQLITTHPIACKVKDTVEVFSFFDSITYEKGASVLKILLFVLGRDNFRDSLSKYFKTFQYKNADFQDFIGIMNEFSKDLNLNEWAEMWILTHGLNVIELQRPNSENGYKIIQSPAASQSPTLRTHKISVEVYDQNYKLIGKVPVSVKNERETEFNTDLNGYFLINGENQSFCKIRFDSESLDFFLNDLKHLENGLARLQIYASIWDLVIDSGFSVSKFLSFAKTNILSENQIINLIFLVKVSRKALIYQQDLSLFQSTSHEIFNILLEKLNNFGEEKSLVIKNLLVFILFNHDDILTAVKWITNNEIELNQALRWKILKKYAEISEESKDLIENESANDRTHSGLLQKVSCENSYPSPSLKEKIWDILTTQGETIPKMHRIKMMKAFNIFHQQDLLAPYAEKYFSQIVSISDHPDLEFSLDFAKKMLPKYLNYSTLINYLESTLEKIPDYRNDIKIFLNKKLSAHRSRKIIS